MTDGKDKIIWGSIIGAFILGVITNLPIISFIAVLILFVYAVWFDY